MPLAVGFRAIWDEKQQQFAHARGILVLTGDWWLYNTALAALNCPQLPECDVLFALATTPNDVNTLRSYYPGRAVLRTVSNGSRVDLVPQS